MGKDVKFRSDMTVKLVQSAGDDASILAAMLVSTLGTESLDILHEVASYGRINFLMKNRHGSPFEHGSMTFFIEAPIMVFREWHRHRVGWSYNEISGRYSELEPVFYVPDMNRKFVQVGKPGAYEFVKGTHEQYLNMCDSMKSYARIAHQGYCELLEQGVAKELARTVLPVSTYSSMYATCNPRSLMSFLSLRTLSPDSHFPSYPQREIEICAEGMEKVFASLYPLTYRSFCENGRVSP